MAQTTFAQWADPVINVIGQNVPGSSSGPASSHARQARLDNRAEVAGDVAATAISGTPGRSDARPAPAVAPSVDAGAAVNVASPHDAVSQPRSAAAGRSAANDEPDAARRYVGELGEHGSAPCLHNPARSDAYYVLFRDQPGVDQAVWGVDLERDMRESGAGIGQQVALENLGKRLVTFRVPILDGEGRLTGEEDKDVYRNTWQVEVVQRDLTASTCPPHSAGPADVEPRCADSRVPPVTEDESWRRGARRRESEQALHLAVLTATMREQGFSERSIACVRQCAARMLVAFEKEGIPVLTPKVFDPKAPSGRDRPGRPTPGPAPAREIDRTPAESLPMFAAR